MRRYFANLRLLCAPGMRFAGVLCVAVLLMLAAPVQARTHHGPHGRRARTAHSRARQPVRARVHRVARHRRRSGRRARSRRYRLEARLDQVRTHTTPMGTEAGPEETIAGASGVEAPRPLSLTGVDDSAAAAGTNAAQSGAEERGLPVFQSEVPRYMPVALRGSHEVLVHQNIVADVEGLRRIQNESQLSAMVHDGDLVGLPGSAGLAIDARLPLNRRYCRPWTAKFLSDLSHAHEEIFGRPLQLTSAVRTVSFQRHLAHYNGNAAPAYGDTASPHLTGEAIDLGKKGMSQHEIAWMRTVLGQLQNQGKIDVEEEFEQACFHISVYRTYAPHDRLPVTLVASDAAEPAAPAAGVIGGLARPALQPVARTTWRHSRAGHPTRRPVARRRRRHRRSMSLLAVRMR